MNVTEIPFNKLIGLAASDDPRYLLMLQAGKQYANHLGTVHASALFALAEATSGTLLLGEFPDRPDLGSVLRKVETKYRNPGYGAIYSSAALIEDKRQLLKEIDDRGRGLAHVAVDLFEGSVQSLTGAAQPDTGVTKPVARFEFEWFITKISQ